MEPHEEHEGLRNFKMVPMDSQTWHTESISKVHTLLKPYSVATEKFAKVQIPSGKRQ